MKRTRSFLIASAVVAASLLVGLPSASAIHPTFSVTLSSTNPDIVDPLGFSGHCNNADAQNKQIHMSVFDIAAGQVVTQVDALVDASGDYSGMFAANWADTVGFYQVVGLCPLQPVDGGYQASPVVTVTDSSVQSMSVSITDGDFTSVDVSGSACNGDSVDWSILDSEKNEVVNRTSTVAEDGTWSEHAAVTGNSPFNSSSAFIAYAKCVNGDAVTALYSTRESTSATTTLPAPTTLPGASTTVVEPTSSTVATPLAAAQPVGANPSYTG